MPRRNRSHHAQLRGGGSSCQLTLASWGGGLPAQHEILQRLGHLDALQPLLRQGGGGGGDGGRRRWGVGQKAGADKCQRGCMSLQPPSAPQPAGRKRSQQASSRFGCPPGQPPKPAQPASQPQSLPTAPPTCSAAPSTRSSWRRWADRSVWRRRLADTTSRATASAPSHSSFTSASTALQGGREGGGGKPGKARRRNSHHGRDTDGREVRVGWRGGW